MPPALRQDFKLERPQEGSQFHIIMGKSLAGRDQGTIGISRKASPSHASSAAEHAAGDGEQVPRVQVSSAAKGEAYHCQTAQHRTDQREKGEHGGKNRIPL